MSASVSAVDLLLLLAAALAPALIYLTWVRSSERYRAEPWSTVLGLFAYGALFATFVAALIEVVLVSLGTAASQAFPAPEFTFLNGNSPLGSYFLILVIAPFVEEGIKASGVLRQARVLRTVADGPVFGASVGLGFGFFETLIYGISGFLVGGLEAGLLLVFVRSFSSVLLHGSTTAMFGYGYTTSKLEGRSGASGGYYLLAVAMHASFNALVSLGAIATGLGYASSIGDYADLFGLLLAILFAVAAINHVVGVIHRTSFPSADGTLKYRPPSLARRPPAPGSRR